MRFSGWGMLVEETDWGKEVAIALWCFGYGTREWLCGEGTGAVGDAPRNTRRLAQLAGAGQEIRTDRQGCRSDRCRDIRLLRLCWQPG